MVEESVRFRAPAQLLDDATDVIIVHDFDGNIVYTNEAAYKTRRYSKDELMGMGLRALTAPEDAKVFKKRQAELWEQGKAAFEAANICKDGSVILLEVHARVTAVGNTKLVLYPLALGDVFSTLVDFVIN